MTYEAVVDDIKGLSEENISAIGEFIQYLKYKEHFQMERKATPPYRTGGGFLGEVKMTEDFFETPDEFKEYL